MLVLGPSSRRKRLRALSLIQCVRWPVGSAACFGQCWLSCSFFVAKLDSVLRRATRRAFLFSAFQPPSTPWIFSSSLPTCEFTISTFDNGGSALFFVIFRQQRIPPRFSRSRGRPPFSSFLQPPSSKDDFKLRTHAHLPQRLPSSLSRPSGLPPFSLSTSSLLGSKPPRRFSFRSLLLPHRRGEDVLEGRVDDSHLEPLSSSFPLR